jgi:putative transposase
MTFRRSISSQAATIPQMVWGPTMARRHTAEEIVVALRKVHALMAQGQRVKDAVLAVNVTEMTYYRWLRRYDRMDDVQAEWVTRLQAENARLRRAVANLMLDRLILLEISRECLSTPTLRRACVEHIQAALGVSERRACQVLGQYRSTQRKVPKLPTNAVNGAPIYAQARDPDRKAGLALMD